MTLGFCRKAHNLFPSRFRPSIPKPNYEVCTWGNAAQFSEPGCILRPMIMAVHRHLHERVPKAYLQRRIKPRDLQYLLKGISVRTLQALSEIGENLLAIAIQRCGLRKVVRLLVIKRRSSRPRDPQERMLYHVNVIKTLIERLISQCSGVRFERSPVFGIRPFLVS